MIFHKRFPFNSWVFGVYICAALLFGSRTNVFLSGKAEIAVETRQVFHRHTAILHVLQLMELSVQTQGQRSALSLPSTLLLCRKMRVSGAHAHDAVLGLVLVLVLGLPAPRPLRYQRDHSPPAQNQDRADPYSALDHSRRLLGYPMPADG